MSKIKFTIQSRTPSRIDLLAETDNKIHAIWFKFSEPMNVSTSLIALAASSFCGEVYEEIHFDFQVEEETNDIIKAFTRTRIVSQIIPQSAPRRRHGHLLSFSGGFDSLAALALMPEETNLVSIDFGGNFARERIFFAKFNPLIIETNVRQTPLVHNSWAYMSIGAILASDHFNAKYHAFGSILASSISKAPKPGSFSLIRAANMISADYIRGITEVATVLLILRKYPHLIRESLTSLSGPRDEKRVRKSLLALSLAKKSNIEVDFDESMIKRDTPVKFGRYFANDFVTSYLLANEKIGMVNRYFSDVPESERKEISSMSLGFMEKYNPDFYEHFPSELLPELYQRMSEFGIYPYTSADWHEFDQLSNLLLKLHPSLA